MTKAMTWNDRVKALRNKLGQKPTLRELVVESRLHKITPEEVEKQRQSFMRGMKPTGDPEFD